MNFTKILRANRSGFTLMELVITISLLVISVGVTSDVILTLVRSYTKNQIATEVEQAANFVFLKLEKELRAGSSVTGGGTSITFVDSSNTNVTYSVTSGVVQRNTVALTQNNSSAGSVTVTCGTNCFTLTTVNGIQSVRLDMTFSQTTLAGQSPITYTISNTIVPRGNY